MPGSNYGRIEDPNWTDWRAWKVSGQTQDAVNLRIRKRVARSRMQRFRSVPVTRRIWWVTLSSISCQESDFGSHDLAHGLTFSPQAFWCLSRRRAQSLVSRDRLCGGAGTLYPVEYRLCPNCSRILLGPEAHDYRMKQMRPQSSWHFERGPACNSQCHESKVGRPKRSNA